MSDHIVAPGVSISPQCVRLAQYGRCIALGGIVMSFGVLMFFCSSQARFAMAVDYLLPQIHGTIDAQAWFWGALVLAANYGIFLWAMILIAALFRAISERDILGDRTDRVLRRLSYAVATAAIFAIAQRTLLGLIVTWANAPGERQVIVQFSSDDLLKGLAAIFLFLFARIIGEARRIDQENRGFV
jgi:Protein of unknown function (DUF2975)